MKNVILALFLFLPLISQANNKVIVCSSFNVVNGWGGLATKVNFTADVNTNTQLSNAHVSGAITSDVRQIKADTTFVAPSAHYLGYNRFSALEDAWCWYMPVLPKNVGHLSTGSKVEGYIQMFCEDGQNRQAIAVSCFIK